MSVTLSTKVPIERRDEFTALAYALDTTPSALLRNIINRYIDGESGLQAQISALRTDASRILVLTRFLAEGVDAEATELLLEETDLFLKGAPTAHPNGTTPAIREAGHG